LQSVLIAGNRLRLVIFLGEQIAPCDESLRVTGIALGDDFQDIVRIVVVLGRPQGAGDPQKIVRIPYDSILKVLDQLFVDGLGFFTFSGILEKDRLLILRSYADIGIRQNRIYMRERLIVVS